MIGFYVWDYPGVGVEFIRRFWDAASVFNPAAADLNEERLYPFCTQEGLTNLVSDAGLTWIECVPMEILTTFRNFDDFWHPFTLGVGPAPGYCMSLDPESRQALKENLQSTLPCASDGAITLKARAWAVKGELPE